MPLPKFQPISGMVEPKDFNLLQTNWSAILDPIVDRQQNRSNLLLAVPLIIGTNIINHKLGRKLVGWNIIGQDAAAAIYDAQATNQSQELTLVLISNAVVNLKLEVF